MPEKECVTANSQMFQEALKHMREELQCLCEQVSKTEERHVVRIAEVEKSQKMVLFSAKKSLDIAVKTQRRLDQLEGRSSPAITKERYDDSATGQRMRSAPGSRSSSSRNSPMGNWCAQDQTRGCRSLAELDVKLAEHDRLLATLGADPRLDPSGLLQSFEARLRAELSDSTGRLDELQAQIDEATAPIGRVSSSLISVRGRLDALEVQSQGHESKLSKHEVRINMLAGHVEAQPCVPSSPSTTCTAPAEERDESEKELAGRVDAHSVALTEIFGQLQTHSDTLGLSRSSSRSSSLAQRTSQVSAHGQRSTPAVSRSSSRGCLGRHAGPPPQSISAALAGSSGGLLRSSLLRGR